MSAMTMSNSGTVGNLHGQSSCFLPLLQNDEDYIAPRIVQVRPLLSTLFIYMQRGRGGKEDVKCQMINYHTKKQLDDDQRIFISMLSIVIRDLYDGYFFFYVLSSTFVLALCSYVWNDSYTEKWVYMECQTIHGHSYF
jgi:hypothetical protein